MKIKLIAGLFLLFTLNSCKKNEEKSTITVNSPMQGMEYTSPVAVDIDFSNPSGPIHDIEIKIYPTASPSTLVFDYDNHVEVKTFSVNDQFSANVTTVTPMTLSVKCGEGDLVVSKEVNFSVKP
jgi:hypothetical protein